MFVQFVANLLEPYLPLFLGISEIEHLKLQLQGNPMCSWLSWYTNALFAIVLVVEIDSPLVVDCTLRAVTVSPETLCGLCYKQCNTVLEMEHLRSRFSSHKFENNWNHYYGTGIGFNCIASKAVYVIVLRFMGFSISYFAFCGKLWVPSPAARFWFWKKFEVSKT